MKWIYDIETYPNCFSFAIIREDGKHAVTYEVSTRKNQIDKVFACLDYLAKQGDFLVGFNSLNFDYPVLHKVLQLRKNNKIPLRGENLASKVYQFAQEQIESMKGEFASTVPVDEHYVKQIDLFKIHHFDNKAKSTSLKMLEFNMRASNISDLPFPVGKHLTSDEIDVLLHYNAHDVKMTLEFYKKTVPMIEFREQLTNKYNRNFMNHNDTKIGKDYFIMRLEEEGIPVYIKDNHGRRKANQTKRSMIKIKDCLFDYYDFTRPEFIAVHEWFKRQVITETKGVFSDIEEHLLGDVAKYAEMVVKRKKFPKEPNKNEYDQFKREHPCGWVERIELKAKKKGEPQYSYWGMWKVAETLNVVIDGFRFDFGVGGIHGSLSEKVAKANNTYMIIDADVSSMYPNIAISNRVFPKHLTDKFCDIYKDMYEQRKSYKKGTPENAMLKLALNGTYGESNNPFGVFYDPQFTMYITVNGQLSLCLLAEKLMQLKGMKIAQVNTDGVTVAIKRKDREQYDTICKQWEQQVGLQLEYAEYETMWIRDVNNYIAEYTNGKVKRKGAYQYEDLGFHQNQSSLVIPMAAEAKMLHGTDIREFITQHNEIYDFMLRVKVPRSSRLVLVDGDGVEHPQQNICRYYPCKTGGKLVKIMPPLEGKDEERRLSIDKEWNVKTCNDIAEFDGDIDYDYYIAEAEKLVIGG